jgi:DNA repair photolyase
MTEKYFPDQPIVKGADVIYRPAGNAGEYAPLATNPYQGCGHGCKYCYVPLATHQDRAKFNEGAALREGYLDRLWRDVARHRAAGICAGHPADQVFITFSSDPFHLGDLDPTRRAMILLRQGGMAFCTLTKGGRRSLPFLELYRPARDAYAATLTSLDARFQQRWEPKAAAPFDRMLALRKFHEAGIFTWVSIEPTIDVEHSLAVIEATAPFVDLFKVGKANYLKKITTETDWRGYTLRVVELLTRLGVRHYIKRDLQEHLPPGYDNPLRVPQYRT